MHRNAPQRHVIAADLFHDVMFEDRRSMATVDASVRRLRDAVVPGYPEPDTPDGLHGDGHDLSAARRDAEVLAGEVYARLYEGNKVARVDVVQGAAWERRVHDALDGSDDFSRLAAAVSSDPDFAALALAGVLDQVAQEVGGMLGDGDQGGGDQGGGAGWGISSEDALQAAIAVAADELRQQLDDTREALNGLAPGLGDTPPGRDKGDPRRLALAEQLRDDARLRDVLRKAGRLQAIDARTRKTRTAGHTEVVDVERGRDLSRLLPSVLAMLDDPDLADITLADVVEGKALQYAMGGEAPLGRGPIVVLRDVSGSMRGEPHAWAAAVCILAAQVADKERRQVTIADFNREIHAAYRLSSTGRAMARDGDGWREIGGLAELVLAVAGTAARGGTLMDPALTWAMDRGDLMQDRADLLVVTDGRADTVRPDLLARLEACKGQGLRVSGLVINGGRLSPALAAVCDSMVDLDRPGDTARQAVQGVRL